jgi:hypothetical protein
MTAPNKPVPYVRPHVDPAPTLLKNWRCSDCNMPSQVIADGNMRICPQCYALLWHTDWSAEARRVRAEAAVAAEYARAAGKQRKHEEFSLRQARKLKLNLSAESLTTSAPELGAPALTENDHEKESDA